MDDYKNRSKRQHGRMNGRGRRSRIQRDLRSALDRKREQRRERRAAGSEARDHLVHDVYDAEQSILRP